MGEKQGQWSVRETLNSRDVAFAIEEGRRPIADVYDSECAGVPHTEVSRRARLIAAAPDLLEALQELMEPHDEGLDDNWDGKHKERLGAARAAIEKATGDPDAQ